MDIVISTDRRYLTPAKVTIASVCQQNRDQSIVFHVLTNFDACSNITDLSFIADKFGQVVKYYNVNDALIDGIIYENANHPIYFSPVTYYRLFMSELLPDEVHKAIYMDCDVLCVGPLADMWNIDMTGLAICGASDMYEGDISFYNRLQYYPSEGYFNAGVLLINLDYWRNNDCKKKFLDFIGEHSDRIFHHDQDILNFTLRKSKGRLPFKYNVQDGYLYREIHLLIWPFEEEFQDAVLNPVLIHYTGRFKPWCDECNHPWRHEYMDVAESIGLSKKDFPVINPDKVTIYQKVRSLLVKMNIVPPTLSFRDNLPYLKRP